jgi:hypothetical protein
MISGLHIRYCSLLFEAHHLSDIPSCINESCVKYPSICALSDVHSGNVKLDTFPTGEKTCPTF